MNFLEQLMGEWYGYQGYFVRSNVKFGLRPKGGYEGEIDVVAFHPNTRELVHVEASGDADSWQQRRDKFKRQFGCAARHYDELFPFQPSKITKVAVVGYTRPKVAPEFGGDIKVLCLPDLMDEIRQCLLKKNPLKQIVPEGYPLLRAMQLAFHSK